MGGILGGSSTVKTGTKYDYLNITTATFGEPIPIVFGTHMVNGNCIDYIDFTIITNKKKSGKGGGVTTESYTYKVAAAIGLCEGEISGIARIWDSGTAYKKHSINPNISLDGSTISKINSLYYDSDGNALSSESVLDAFYGSLTQSAWSYMQSKHPERALRYPYIAYAAGYVSLGSTNSLPSYGFEILGKHIYGSGNLDCEPYLMVTDLLTDNVFGINYPTPYLGSMTNYRNYCLASGIFLSYSITSQSEVSEALNNIIKATNTQPVNSQGTLYFIPYGTTTITGNGATYTPNLTPIYSLSDQDFIYTGEDPVKFSTDNTSDIYNFQQLTFKNRDNEYASDVVSFEDLASIDDIGLKKADSISLDCICREDVASIVLQNIAERTIYYRDPFTFQLPYFPFILLDPMDICSMIEEYLGLENELIRVVSLDVDSDKIISMTVELVGVTGSGTVAYDRQAPISTTRNTAVPPGDVNQPIFFDPPSAITGGILTTYIAASSSNSNWGGCNIWASLDGNSYGFIGTINGAARTGKLSSSLPIITSADPEATTIVDTTNTLRVDLTESNGELSSGTQDDADNYVTLCYVDGELLSYQTANLTATHKYNLTYLVRGIYGTTISAHAVNSQFVRLDNNNIFKYTFADNYIGKTIYVKFTSFNIYGQSEQTLDEVTAYQHVLTNNGKN